MTSKLNKDLKIFAYTIEDEKNEVMKKGGLVIAKNKKDAIKYARGKRYKGKKYDVRLEER